MNIIPDKKIKTYKVSRKRKYKRKIEKVKKKAEEIKKTKKEKRKN